MLFKSFPALLIAVFRLFIIDLMEYLDTLDASPLLDKYVVNIFSSL